MYRWRALLYVAATIPYASLNVLAKGSAPSGSGFDATKFEDTAAGLQRLLTDSIASARANDSPTVDQVLESMRIPDPDKWVRSTS
jgi:hypothetical protein